MTDEQEAMLLGGGDCPLHYHTFDQNPTGDTVRRLQQLKIIATPTTALDMATSSSYKNADIVRANPAAPFTVTLPTAIGSGREITLYRIAAQTITIAVQTGDTLNGTLNGTTTITANYTPRTFKDVLITKSPLDVAWEEI